MKTFIAWFFYIMIAGNAYASHVNRDILDKIPQYESQESLDSFNSSVQKKQEHCYPLIYRSTGPLLNSEKVFLTIFVQGVSSVEILHGRHSLWRCDNLRIEEQKRQFEVCFFKKRTNELDEYVVSVDNQTRKCMFPANMQWELAIEGNCFKYKKKS